MVLPVLSKPEKLKANHVKSLQMAVTERDKKVSMILDTALKQASNEWAKLAVEISNFAQKYGRKQIEQFMFDEYGLKSRDGNDSFVAAAKLAFIYKGPNGEWKSRPQQVTKYSQAALEISSWNLNDKDAIDRLGKQTFTETQIAGRETKLLGLVKPPPNTDPSKKTATPPDPLSKIYGNMELVVGADDEIKIFLDKNDFPPGRAIQSAVVIDDDGSVKMIVPMTKMEKSKNGKPAEKIIFVDGFVQKYNAKAGKK